MKQLSMVLALGVLGCGSAGPAPRTLRAPMSTPPSARDAIAAIGAHADVQATDISCQSVAEGGTTLGDIEAHLLGQLVEAQAQDDPATLIAQCEGEQAPWSCVIGVRIAIDDPWDYRITFNLDAAGNIETASIRCPGTG